MTLDLIKTFKIQIYTTEYTKNTNIYFGKSKFSKHLDISKKKIYVHFNQRFPLIFMSFPKTSWG